MSDPIFAQACLTPRLGGLGLRKVVEHANLAYHASWHEAQKTAQEVWVPPPGLPAQYLPQKEASFAFDEKMHAYLVDNADERGAQRLRRAAQPHACGFITAVPSDEDGKDTLLRPRNFQIAVAYRLWESTSWKMKSLALCARSLLTNLAIMPVAAQSLGILLLDTTLFAT